MENLPKIDVHSHILPNEIPDFKSEFGYGGFIQLENKTTTSADMTLDDGTFFRTIDCNCWDPHVRKKEYEKWSHQIQLISTVPVMFSYWAKPNDGLKVSKFLNDDIAKTVKRFPKNYIGLGTLPMQDPVLAGEELERITIDLGLNGIEIGSRINDWKLNAKELEPLWEVANKLKTPIFVHPWDMPWKEEEYWMGWLVGMPAETTRAMNSLIFGGILERYPNIRFAFAHGGGSFPGTFGRIRHGFNVRPDLLQSDNKIDPIEYIGKFWIDSLVHDQLTLDYIINFIGEDKIMLGSDYPFPLGEMNYPGRLIDESKLSISQRDKLLSTNAFEWLNLRIEQYRL